MDLERRRSGQSVNRAVRSTPGMNSLMPDFSERPKKQEKKRKPPTPKVFDFSVSSSVESRDSLDGDIRNVLSDVRHTFMSCIDPEIIEERELEIIDYSLKACYNATREGKKIGLI
eukprot:CAMPEP_0194273518 /NCGR_PEP_ID=MMETSP0169-20130528/6843_1 /TAXON_ID=218684 /ORGANISM="Corethron pennatum, Strain L29A3" /LENGTH=114 /DNA_ID=CAMNT_0039016499 /DNA_START=608 /DNA_END=952 /DNA_ORIENTATION=+